ncbi:MAG: DNA polymerase I [candidate division KSB1 bacterium]|nr:DNA polymerase I [candidate division KSB1 bacterium]
MSNPAKRLFLIDGMALAYRVYYAFVRNPLINSKGENVSAVFGFANVLLKLIDEHKPDYLAVVFDTPQPTFRHERFEEYKATRKEMPEEMVEQLPRIREMLQVLNVPLLELPGYEADDIIGTLAKRAEEKGIETFIVSGDKDMMQLVGPKIKLLVPRHGGKEEEILDEQAIREKIGLSPAQIIDYLALMGDSSDNIPGVSGIGPVAASKLLQEFGTLEAVLANVEKISDKRSRTALEKGAESALLSKELAAIHCNVPVDIQPEQLSLRESDRRTVFQFFQRMEFRSLAERFIPDELQKKRDYRLIQSEAELEALAQALETAGRWAFDTETTDPDPMRAELVGLSFSFSDDVAYYVPVRGPQEFAEPHRPLPIVQVLQRLKPIFENEAVLKCGHNAKYDMIVLSRCGVKVKGLAFDTMVAGYLLDPSARQHNLDAMALTYFDLKKIRIEDVIGSGAKQIRMDQAPIARVAEYACEDAEVTWKLWRTLEPKIDELELRPLLEEIEMPLVSVLMTMEMNGVKIDVPYLEKMSKNLEVELAVYEQEIYKLAGCRFNINSPKQLAEVLYDKLKLKTAKRTKTGFSTDVNALEELSREHELPKAILSYRHLAKLKSTYVDALPKLVNPKTGRVHTSYNQTVTATGRLSSSEPNLQNIPIRTEIGSSIRAAFIPTNADYVIVDADYSQIELRIMAQLSGDPGLRAAFAADEDVHTRTAALIFGIDPKEVTAEQRRRAKEVNFGIMYGMGPYGLSQRLDITPEEATEFISAYFKAYPGVQNYMTNTVREARNNGYVTTLFKRRRYIPDINSDNRRVREFAERTAINTPIQGSAADMIKIAMIRIQKRFNEEKLGAKMIMQVHDELVFDVPKSEQEAVKELIRREMEKAVEMEVPVKVEIGVGDNWLQAHP